MTRPIVSRILAIVIVACLTPAALGVGWMFNNPGNQIYGIKSVGLTGGGPEGEDALLLQFREVEVGDESEWVEYGPGWTIQCAPGAMPSDPFETTSWSKTVHGPDGNNQPPWDSTYPVGHYMLQIWDPGPVKEQFFFVIQM